MSERIVKNEWLCIQCGRVLGKVLGGELYPAVDVTSVHTSGPNLAITCPDCGFIKTWYTSDPLVRAIYQLVDAISTTAARSMVQSMSQAVHKKESAEK